MGVWDSFIPVPTLLCPVCAADLGKWEGRGNRAFFLEWEQGLPNPARHLVDPDLRLSAGQLADIRPTENVELSGACPAGHVVDAEALIRDGIWSESRLTSVLDGRAWALHRDVFLWRSRHGDLAGVTSCTPTRSSALIPPDVTALAVGAGCILATRCENGAPSLWLFDLGTGEAFQAPESGSELTALPEREASKSHPSS